MYPKVSTYRLHSLQSQLTVYVLIFLLNTERDSESFMSADSVLQSFCPRNRTVSVPNLIVLTFGKHMFPPSLSSYEGTSVRHLSYVSVYRVSHKNGSTFDRTLMDNDTMRGTNDEIA